MDTKLNKYEVFTNIDTATYDWQCRVRAQSIWKGINEQTQQCWGINIIFLDDSNNRLHAFVSSKNADKLSEEIKEGDIYVLSNFKVKHYLGHETYRAVRTDKHIYFTEHTRCVKDTSPGLSIEPYTFDLFALEEIEKHADDNRFLIDVVGIVRNLKPKVTTVKNDVETRRVMFKITDGRSFINVTLFNEFGEQHEHLLDQQNREPVVIIIAAAKIHKYEGKINLTNFPATRLYVNPSHHSVEEVKNNYKEMATLEISSEDEEEKKEIISIAHIKALGSDFIEKNVTIQATLKRMDEKGGWYYTRCAKCNIEILQQDGKYKCTKCTRLIPHPDKRFRVFAFCTDSIGTIGIILPDSQIRKLVNKTVFDIQAEYIEEPTIEPFPAELKQLQHKEYTVTIKISEENIKNGSTVYEASTLNNALEISATFSPSKTVMTEQNDLSMLHESEAPVHLNETPTTEKSTNVKMRVRKAKDALKFHVDDGVATELTTPIKKEKNS